LGVVASVDEAWVIICLWLENLLGRNDAERPDR
jgi:hypothetical protein